MKTCMTCADDSCPDHGSSQVACDEWTSREETQSPEVPDAVESMAVRLAAIEARFETFQRAAADFIRTLEG